MVVVENVGGMLPLHRRAMAEALAIQDYESRGPRINAAQWTVFPRRRLFLSTRPAHTGAVRPRPRPVPWDAGWEPRFTGDLPTMGPARGCEQGVVRASTDQYHPRYLLYHCGAEVGTVPPARIPGVICATLPAELRAGWDNLNTVRRSPQDGTEQAAARTAAWVARHGPGHGFRAPSVAERARAAGMPA